MVNKRRNKMNSLDVTGGPGANQPNYSIDTVQGKKGKLEVTLSDSEGNAATVIGKRLIKIKNNKELNKRAKIHKSTVRLNVNDNSTNKQVRVSVKIKDLASALKISKGDVENAVKQGDLDNIVSNNLQSDLLQQTQPEKKTAPVETDRINVYSSYTYKEKVGLAYRYAENLAVLHKDLGPDLELAAPFGYSATPGYIAPETVGCLLRNEDCFTDFSTDVWTMGCKFAELMETTWFDMNGQKQGNNELILDENELNRIKNQCFPAYEQPGTMDYLMDRCLDSDPENRPTARQVADYLGEILKDPSLG